MNPSSSGSWDIPPPPGTELDFEPPPDQGFHFEPPPEDPPIKKLGSRPIDRIDPYLKNPEYIRYERSRYYSRSRSRSPERHRSKRKHSRSRSRDKHRRSKSRSRRRKRSKSRSRSRSNSYSRSHRRHKRNRHSRSRSRSHSTSRSHRSHRHRSEKTKHSSTRSRRSKSTSVEKIDNIDPSDVKQEIKTEEEDEIDDEAQRKENAFKNDGSFLEMFKKMQEEQAKAEAEKQAAEKKSLMPTFGKRRGGKVLKTGVVQKLRTASEELAEAQDAWSVYMKEVKRYKEACCDDDSKTRPLVK